ncbi:TnsA-like heteromeric transposase endonuclease subunit [Kitasatospora sp. RG8]|uniref:TnsA-like heteromeric transposase endonuclease subunit n=1 Tax=Kitasatospora sp. RG8 TaxID=2820815 RepID=UPI001ADF9854|nr:TnsA-like heteromeric transposase endonuclease subunit [Kitasatospora sp. RG8]MBP0452095.1 TnsA-like heteromeric transposase endonuclease subunit [Kitasatospora sp. RG8]
MEAEDFCLEYADVRGRMCRGPLEVMWPARFEDGLPVRGFSSFKGQRNFTGWYWAATGAVHIGFESWVERDHLMRLDFDPLVSAVVSQPFRLSWRVEGRRRRVEHTPDYFVRRLDGSALVVDVRPDERIEPEDAAKFAATAVACARVGWGYQRLGVVSPVLAANLRWLAGYRHPRVMRESVADLLRAAFTGERNLLEGAQRIGDPVAVLPVLYHLLWRQELVVELETALLSGASPVGPGRILRKVVTSDGVPPAAAVGW